MSTLKKLQKEWLSLQPLKPELQRQMDQSFMIDFNYNSNHLEGNTLTYGQTKLLLLFGDTMGNASMQDYEEMKAHNVGLEMMKVAALDKERSLSEMFIRELNKIILVRDFYKTSSEHRYKIKVGMYKTRPNSVITPTGELFDYASPEVDTELSESDRIDLATGGQKGGQNRWSEILELIKENPSIARKELSEKLNINPSAIQKHIQKMKEANIIRRVGADRGGYWEIVK